MQVLISGVNTERADRVMIARSSATCRNTAASGRFGLALHQALAVVILGHPGAHALAVVGVGLAVAAAHRPVDARTESWHSGAGATDVGEETFAGLFLTEQAAVALLRGDHEAAACLADPDRIGPGRN